MYIILYGPGGGFPNGTAPTARVIAYGRGLVQLGSRVMVLCLGPSEYSDVGVLNQETKGVWKGIEFEYTSGTTLRGRASLQQLRLVVKGLAVASWRLIVLARQERLEAFILYPDRLATAFWFWLIARLCGAVYLLEKSEQPFLQAEKSYRWKLYSEVYTHTVFKLFDGMIVISDYLREYMKPRVRRGARLLKIPILVDTEIFKPLFRAPSDVKYIAYCGTLNEPKDGVITLMRAFALLSSEFPGVRLMLIGDGYKKTEIPTFRAKAREYGIGDRVIFTGLVARDLLPQYLGQATVLALARPSSKQAEAGFPTKVGEYLATGNPVVVTRVGELDKYLQDGSNVFFAQPDDQHAFADRLRYVLSHQEEAVAVGANGRNTARQFFDYRVNGKRLQAFVTSMRANQRLSQSL